jgi:hypothetical protein
LGTKGPISKAWCVRGWPTVYVLDHEGRIRFRGRHALTQRVKQLLAEMK